MCDLQSLGLDAHYQWALSAECEPRLSVRGCALRRFTREEAHKCLDGQSVVLVGDSITRYQ